MLLGYQANVLCGLYLLKFSIFYLSLYKNKNLPSHALEHLGPHFKPWNPSYRIMTQVRLTERIGVSSSSISVGWQTIQSSCHLPTRQYNRANIALLTSTIDTLPDRKNDRGYEDMRENKVSPKLPGHKQHFQGQ